MNYYTLYDVVTGEYGVLFNAVNHDDVKRKLAFSQQSNPYIGDLKLFFVGEFDRDKGIIHCDKPEFLCNLSDIVEFDPNFGHRGE